MKDATTRMIPVFLLICVMLFAAQCSADDSNEIPNGNDTEDPDTPKPADQRITINASIRTHPVAKNPGGVVSCWLMDSDIKRPRATSFADAMKDMGVKYIRFPYGHLSDNYLWDADGDWGNTLTPKVATFNRAPGGWNWAVDQTTGEFIDAMDFDEFIAICNDVGAEPMVVVNILSHKYPNGPTYEQLKESAVEWVRYANITKGYNVKYWALGNEVDHHSNLISREEYQSLYSDFANAMKEVDPNIWIGPGLLSNWHAALLNHDPDNIYFMCVHNYLWRYEWRLQGYEAWKHATDIIMHHVENVQNIVSNSSLPDLEIHVTEMNAFPWGDDVPDKNDLIRSLTLGEMILNAISFKNVKATYTWNTHSPWGGPDVNASFNVLDLDNNREPLGEMIKLVNDNLLDYFIDVPRLNGFIRSYATIDEQNENISMMLFNKNDKAELVNIRPLISKVPSGYSIISYTGTGPYDESPSLTEPTTVEVIGGVMNVELPPLSFNVITWKMR